MKPVDEPFPTRTTNMLCKYASYISILGSDTREVDIEKFFPDLVVGSKSSWDLSPSLCGFLMQAVPYKTCSDMERLLHALLQEQGMKMTRFQEVEATMKSLK